MSFVATYDPSRVVLEVAGYKVDNIQSISCDKHKPTFKLIKGIRGSYTRCNNLDLGYDITVTLSQMSAAHDVFSQIALADLQYNTGKLLVTLKDINGKTEVVCYEAFLEGFPSFGFQAEQQDRTWKIICPVVSVNIEGNVQTNFNGGDVLAAALQAILL